MANIKSRLLRFRYCKDKQKGTYARVNRHFKMKLISKADKKTLLKSDKLYHFSERGNLKKITTIK